MKHTLEMVKSITLEGDGDVTLVHPAIIRTLGRTVESYGVDFNALLSMIGITLTDDSETRIQGSLIDKVWRAAVDATKDDALGVKFANHFQLGSLNGLGFSWVASNSLLDGFSRLSRFFGVISSSGKIEIKEDEYFLKIALVIPVPYGIAENAGIDAGLALFVQLCRMVRYDMLSPISINMQRPEPLSKDAFNDFFLCPINYNSKRNELVFDKAELQKVSPVANPELARANDQVVIDYLHKHKGENTVSKVSLLIIEALQLGTPTLASIAEHLFMSPKTLQRRLAGEGIMFSELLDNIRLTLANSYLEQTWRSIGEICYLLGFTEHSNFTRWYKGETGQSPVEFRNQKTGC